MHLRSVSNAKHGEDGELTNLLGGFAGFMGPLVGRMEGI
jgi:hypothetical protein